MIQPTASSLYETRAVTEEFNVCALITNQVVSDPGGYENTVSNSPDVYSFVFCKHVILHNRGAMFVSDAKKPIGGHIMAHSSTTRFAQIYGVPAEV